MVATRDIDAAIDQLYQLPLDQFTAERNTLAADLKKAGDRATADRVKVLAKPNLTAWAINQAWWRDRATFTAMLDAGGALLAAHHAIAKGKSADVRRAAEARQRAVEAVVDAAVHALGGSDKVSPDARHRIAGTAEALASSGVPADATLGRLATDLQSSGLDVLSALAGSMQTSTAHAKPPRPTIVSRTPPRDDVDRAAETRAAHAARIADAKGQLAARKAALRDAEAEAGSTAKAEKKARAALDAIAAHVADLEQGLDAAREEERVARRALTQVTKAASEAEMVRARTMRDVAEAQRRVAELQESKD